IQLGRLGAADCATAGSGPHGRKVDRRKESSRENELRPKLRPLFFLKVYQPAAAFDFTLTLVLDQFEPSFALAVISASTTPTMTASPVSGLMKTTSYLEDFQTYALLGFAN